MRSIRTIFLACCAMPLAAYAQEVTAESAIVMDAASGKVLWSKNADEQLYPASTTKIMTALLLLEHCKPEEIITAPADVTNVKESSMHLKPGEQVRAQDMLYALLLRSANDGCYAVAVHVAGSVPKFAEMMNARAKEIGCTHTHFDNPNGLNDPLHYTSAHDLALIGREAMRYPEFRDIVKTTKTKINRGVNWKDLWMTNHNKILKRDPTCDGIKTGWTVPAGHCFVGSANRQGWRVITVVLKSKSWENDTETLFNWAFGQYQKREEVVAGQAIATANIEGGILQQIQLKAADSAYSLVSKTNDLPAAQKIELPPKISAPIAKRQKVGDLVIRDSDGFENRIPLIADENVEAAPSVLAKTHASDSKLWAGAGLLVGAMYIRGRSRKKTQRIFRTR